MKSKLFLLFFFVLSALSLDLCLAASGEEPLTATSKLYPYDLESNQIAQLEISLNLPEGYKAYEDQFRLKVLSPEGVKVSTFRITPLKEIFDKFSKKKKSFVTDKAQLIAPLELPDLLEPGEHTLQIQISYQACTETYCLFPQQLMVDAHFQIKNLAASDVKKGLFDLSFKEVYTKGLGWAFLFVFVFGFLTSFTPCIYPMVPITLAILGKEAHARTRLANFLVSVVYVLGIAMTYSSLGILAATTGALFGSFMASPWVLGFVCVIFFAMALSMFGLFEISIPSSLQEKVFGRSQLHGYAGAFFSGMIAGLITSPCVGPVLVGVLTFVAQTQSLWLGFWLLFVYALGMGILFIALGASTQLTRYLPKSGGWMNRIKILFGVLMLGASIYYLDILLVSSKATSHSLFSTLTSNSKEKSDSTAKKPGFNVDTMNWQNYSEALILKAKAENKPVIIDFRADWCAACLKLEEETFTNQELQLLSGNFVLLRFDATQDSRELKKLRYQYSLIGLPTVVFISRSGKLLDALTLTAFESPASFIARMKKAL